MNILKLNGGPYQIKVFDNGDLTLSTSDGTEWWSADNKSCEIVMMQEIIKMRELLKGVHDHAQASSTLAIKECEVLAAVEQYIQSIPE